MPRIPSKRVATPLANGDKHVVHTKQTKVDIRVGHVLEKLRELPDESVHCVVTSPPYYGLRAYGTDPQVWGGDSNCEHDWQGFVRAGRSGGTKSLKLKIKGTESFQNFDDQSQAACSKCGAWRGELGLEPHLDMYVQHMVEIFREVRRVLRSDGTLWFNIGSSYCRELTPSSYFVVRRNLNEGIRTETAKALSSVWATHASPEQALSALRSKITTQTAKLSKSKVSEMRSGIIDSRNSCKGGSRKILLPKLRAIRESNEATCADNSSLRKVRRAVGTLPSRHEEKQNKEGILQSDVLVQLQQGKQSLPVERRSEWTNESKGTGVEKRRPKARFRSLSNLPRELPTRSASYKTISKSSSTSLLAQQRDNSLSSLSYDARTRRNVCRGDVGFDGENAFSNLADMTFHISTIPRGFEDFCEPLYVIKPKDDLGVPWALATALRNDGWYLRSDIIWCKGNAMPESIQDRPTNATEHVFMFAKSPRYFFDQEAVRRDPAPGNTGVCNAPPLDGYSGGRMVDGNRSKQVKRVYDEIRGGNIRNYWILNTEPFSLAHFAVMPTKLVETCIKASTSEKGVCSKCGAPWVRDILHIKGDNETTTRPKKSAGMESHTSTLSLSGGSVEWMKRGGRSQMKGWKPSCKCDAEIALATALDPFGGSGTVGVVATDLRRNAVLLELNPKYAKMAHGRISGFFVDVRRS
jgi:DNA modification methylase